MAWIENINKGFTITTGDGVKFSVNWLNARRAVDYNMTQYNFKGLTGTLVDRRLPMGRAYDLEIYFQGADNLIKATDFMDSAENTKAWTISHPMYGILQVQPLGLELDDSSFNATKISCRVIETISASFQKQSIDPVSTIEALKLSTDATFAVSFANTIPVPDIAVVTELSDNISLAQRLQLAFATITADAQKTRDAFNVANAALKNAVKDVNTAISTTQAMLNLPAVFEQSVFNRITFFINASNQLYANITSITLPDLKKIYENNTGSILGAMCLSTVTNVTATDYPNRNSVVQIIGLITDSYNDYIANLDAMQTPNNGELNSYVPDFDSYNALQQLMQFTLSNLFDIAANAKQQRTTTLANDSNVILVANTIYGLLDDDSTITQIINDNNIGRNELLILKKGRKIIYYV